MTIDFEKDRMQSVEQIDSAKRLSDKVLELKDLEDEIANAEESLKKLKEKAKVVSSVEIPAMMDDMQITKLKLKDGEQVEIKKIYGASIPKDQQEAAFTPRACWKFFFISICHWSHFNNITTVSCYSSFV